MAACDECGEDHIASAASAAIAFEELLRLMADPHKRLTPSAVLNIHAMIGALLVHYSEYSYEEICGEVARVAENAELVAGLYENMVAVGLVLPDAGKAPSQATKDPSDGSSH